MCLTANNFGLQEENINISNPPAKTIILKRDRVEQKERETDGHKERRWEGLCSVGLRTGHIEHVPRGLRKKGLHKSRHLKYLGCMSYLSKFASYIIIALFYLNQSLI